MKRLLLILIALSGATTAAAQSRSVTVTPTVTASSAYTAKDAVGGVMDFSGFRCPGEGFEVNGVKITDKADQAVTYDLVLFTEQPAGTFTDHGAFDPADADLALMLPVLELSSTGTHFSFADNGVSSLSSLASSGKSTAFYSSSRKLFGALMTTGTPTYATTSDLSVTVYLTCR